tara:strand:+ start:565 stop:732 length:168 start_codon:yes stop_codon:yes gene_type:complete
MKYLIQMEDIPQGWEVKYFEDDTEHSQIFPTQEEAMNLIDECNLTGLYQQIPSTP